VSPALLADRYRLEALLGAGGMGAVHAAFDTRLERRVAIKLLPEASEADAQARARFRREALAAAALDHPYICKVFEVGEHDGRSFIVMEHVDGRTLDAVIAEHSLTPRQVLDLAHELAQALDEAHRRGIIHRDLKPSNIMLTTHGHVKVLDFGLAKHTVTRAGRAGGSGQTVNDTAAVTAADEVTHPGIRLGTPSYMSPEQILGSVLDPRSDIFSLGVVLHELACGQHPFRKESSSETMAAILRDAPRSTETDLDVVPGFGRIVHRMLAKGCAERPQTMRELIDTVDALRERGSSGSIGSGPALAPFAREERTQLVARDAELADLQRRLDQMLLGQGSIVLLGGEPGVGKTRLARELQRLAHERGCFCATGQSYEMEGAPPFGPFIEMLDQGIRAVPQGVRAALGDAAGELSLVFPAIRRAFPDIPAGPVVPPEQLRAVIFNAHLDYLRRATAKTPLVMLLDDLHWADDASLQLVMHLAPHVASMRLLVVGTYRDVELDAQRPFARALETMLRQRQATRVSLKRLGLAGVQEMLQTMSGSAPPVSLVTAVHRETDGNPFFVEEVFEHLKEEGKLFDGTGAWKADFRIEDVDVPEGVRLVISRRLERLGDETRKLLTAAAVIGRTFPLDLVSLVAGEHEDTVLDRLEQAEQAQLLQAERGREARFTFVHELIRGTLLASLSIPRRQRIHLKVADAIEARRPSWRDTLVPLVAHHLYMAGAAAEDERAIPVLVSAMEKALGSGAFEEVLDFVERLGTYELPDGSRERALVEQASLEAHAALGHLDAAFAAGERAFAQWRTLGDDAGIARSTMRLRTMHWWNMGMQPARDALRRGLDALSDQAGRERCTLLAWSAVDEGNGGPWAGPAAQMAEAARLADELDDDASRATVHAATAALHRQGARPALALTHADMALALAGGDVSLRGTALVERLLVIGYVGRVLTSAELDSSRTFAERTGDPMLRWLVGVWLDWYACARDADAEGLGIAAEGWLAVPGAPHFFSMWTIASAKQLQGEGRDALVWMQRAVDAFESQRLWWGHSARTGLSALSVWLGEPAVALEAPDPGMRCGEDGQGWCYGDSLSVWTAVPAFALMKDYERCAAFFDVCVRDIEEGYAAGWPTIGPSSPHLAAAIAASASGRSDAGEWFDAAADIAQHLENRFLAVAVRMWRGWHLLRTPSSNQAGRALLGEVDAELAELGMSIHRDWVRRWLAETPA
jgi:hypothetical protein